MAHSRTDTQYMAEAHRIAQDIAVRPWPNPPVGAVVVKDGAIVGRGVHLGVGTPHAEDLALAQAGERARGATLYVTLEPCNHDGRRPACTPRVIASGVARIVIGLRDPNPKVTGGGLEALRDAGIEVGLGVLARGCLELVWPFVLTEAFARPFVLLKTATTLDGRFAPVDDPAGEPFYLTGAEALAEVARLRRWHDLVLVGRGTVESDDPRLDGRRAGPAVLCPAAEPTPACVDTRLAVAPEWRDDAWVFTSAASAASTRGLELAARGVRVLPCAVDDDGLDPHAVVAAAAAAGASTLMVEGGPNLALSFLRAGLVDRWVQFVAPTVLGEGRGWPDGAVPEAARGFTLTRTLRMDRDACLVWDREEFNDRRRRLAGGGEED